MRTTLALLLIAIVGLGLLAAAPAQARVSAEPDSTTLCGWIDTPPGFGGPGGIGSTGCHVPIANAMSDLSEGDCDWLKAQSPPGWGPPTTTPRACQVFLLTGP